jgi:hypothetical protein
MEYDKYGLLTDTRAININDDFEIFSDEEESNEHKRYIKNIYVRIMKENLRLFLEEYDRKEKAKNMKKSMWYGCCDYCKHDCLMVEEIEDILRNYYFNPVRCGFCRVRHLI